VNRVDVLIAIDVECALSAATLQGSVYLVDSNGYLGSWQEGQTQCHVAYFDHAA